MSNFEVLIERIEKVENHPNADRLTINHIHGYKCISAKLEDGSPRYKEGDLVVYCPEDSVIPEYLLKKGFWNDKTNTGMLAGSKGNRVKAIKLRDILSQGILFSVDMFDGFDPENHFVFKHSYPDVDVEIGLNVAELLGIEKYVPEVPTMMNGKAFYAGSIFPKFDVENIKKLDKILEDGEEVVLSEKLHGTFMISGISPEGKFVISSKNLSHKGITFDLDDLDTFNNNLYVKIAREYDLERIARNILNDYDAKCVYILGEVYGPGVQDLQYSEKNKAFRVFDIFIDDSYLNYVELKYNIDSFGLERAPVLYRGPWSDNLIEEYTSGLSRIDNKTIREGFVVKPVIERNHPRYGRVCLKSVSDDYLTRKGGTEFN